MASFDLLTEPWIPAVARDGTVQEYGLLPLLSQAHNLVGVVDPAPPIQLGLYRLLIAFVMAALNIQDLEDLEKRIQGGPLDAKELSHYVNDIGRDRFDLFDPLHPFLQSPPVAGDDTRVKSVAELFFHLPTGTNVTHFYHMRADQHAISPAVCARGLCAIAPFMTAGGAGYSPSINGTPPWYVLIRGDTLLQTLLLNCYPPREADLAGPVGPAWASSDSLTPKKVVGCDSLLEGLTWRPRQIRFIPGSGGVCTYSGKESPVLVRQMVYGPGHKFNGTLAWVDPQVAYAESDKGRFPLRPREDHPIWRDTGPLLLLRKEDYESEKGHVRFARPLVVDQFRLLKRNRSLERDRPELVDAYGLRADKAKVFEWHFERLSLLPGLLENPRAGAQAQFALNLADSVAHALRTSLKHLYPRAGEGNQLAMDQTIQSAQTAFWSRLRRHFEARFLPTLSRQVPGDLQAETTLLRGWQDAVRQEGWQSLDEAIGPLDTGAAALRRQVEARGQFAGALSKLLSPADDNKKSKTTRKKVGS